MKNTERNLLWLLKNGDNMPLTLFREKYIKAVKDELKTKIDRLKKLK